MEYVSAARDIDEEFSTRLTDACEYHRLELWDRIGPKLLAFIRGLNDVEYPDHVWRNELLAEAKESGLI